MDLASLTRMQIRAVLAAFRSENTRLRRRRRLREASNARQLLRARSVQLLDSARARLKREGKLQPELLNELESARDEVTGDERAEVSVGSRGDRPG